MNRSRKSRPISPAQHAASVIQPVVNGLGAYGSLARLIDTYEEMHGHRPNRSTWHRWLHVAPALRMQPEVGTALAIRAAFDKLKREKKL